MSCHCLVVAVALAGCGSGGKPRPVAVEDAAAPRDAAPSTPTVDASTPTPPAVASGTGDVQVRVEWKDVPVPARASPGRTACNTPRAPAVSPTTTWGIPDALVIVDGAPAASTPGRIVLADCALTPRLVTGDALVVASGVLQPSRLAFARRGELGALPALREAAPVTVQLPIAGHSVAPAVERGGIYELVAGTESAWFVAGNAAVTDASGSVLVKDVPVGTHAVTAWLPPRAGQPARLGRGEVTVEAGDLAELTLQLQ